MLPSSFLSMFSRTLSSLSYFDYMQQIDPFGDGIIRRSLLVTVKTCECLLAKVRNDHKRRSRAVKRVIKAGSKQRSVYVQMCLPVTNRNMFCFLSCKCKYKYKTYTNWFSHFHFLKVSFTYHSAQTCVIDPI